MWALSIQQPWAFCITHATKRIENRTWPPSDGEIERLRKDNYRFLIHTGKQYQTGAEIDIHYDCPEISIAAMRCAPRGGLVGVARLAGVIPPGPPDKWIPEDQRIWTDVTQYNLLVTDVQAFPDIIPYAGQLGFFHVPDAVIRTVLDELPRKGRST